MMQGMTNSTMLKDGVNLIAENHNLRMQLEECKQMLKAYESAWLQEERAKREAEERAKREEEERKARELDEAIKHLEHLMYDRDYNSGYLAKIYGRETPRRGQRRTYEYHGGSKSKRR